ncbi:MAG: hypothetical protein GY753_09760 [Gammaproteobacteria bacterium]|nr:hypothetical protein [Gammaproteobacteria bacterium]
MADTGPISGTFSATGYSAEMTVSRAQFNLSVGGGDATVILERSFDGSIWFAAKTMIEDYEGVVTEVETKVIYRLRCAVYTSGPINYRLGTRFI